MISFSEVNRDQAPLRAFPQRIVRDRRETRLDSPVKLPRVGETCAQTLQRAETELPHAFALHEDPVVVPVGEKVADVAEDAGLGGSFDDVPRPGDRLANIDRD